MKSADSPPGAGVVDLARTGLIDAAFPGFAARFPGRIVLRGPGGDRLCRSGIAECAA